MRTLASLCGSTILVVAAASCGGGGRSGGPPPVTVVPVANVSMASPIATASASVPSTAPDMAAAESEDATDPADTDDGCPLTQYRCADGPLAGWVGRPEADVVRCQGHGGSRQGDEIIFRAYCSLDCDRVGILTFRIQHGRVFDARGVVRYSGAHCSTH